MSPCPYCYGNGQYMGGMTDIPGRLCDVCGGSGRRAKETTLAHAETCPVCRGKGSLLGDTCHGCGGKGWVTVEDSPQAIPYVTHVWTDTPRQYPPAEVWCHPDTPYPYMSQTLHY